MELDRQINHFTSPWAGESESVSVVQWFLLSLRLPVVAGGVAAGDGSYSMRRMVTGAAVIVDPRGVCGAEEAALTPPFEQKT